VKPTPAETITKFLSFSSICNDAVPAIARFNPREWKRVELWLNDSGLAFYFLQKLKDTNVSGAVPTAVQSGIERNFASNQARVEAMSVQFHALNKRFDSAGIRYAVIKGFSLVPQFCPHASLRYQADFDYLVDEDSLCAAQRILIEAGYRSRNSLSSKETIFITPGAKPLRGDEQYSPQAPHAVELHDLQPIPKLFSVDQAKIRDWNGFSFAAQTDEDAFLLQVLHACRHLFTQWIRVSCLFEIGYFLNRRWSDSELWSRVVQRVGDDVVVREFMVIVTELARRLFAAPLPPLIQDLEAGMRQQPRLWLEHYARDWALCELPAYEFSLFPCSKLVLFLQRQYRRAPAKFAPKLHEAAPSRLQRLTSSIKMKPSLLLSAEWRKRNLLIRRGVFWTLAQARYVCEIPRWWWLTRTGPRERLLS
jgi:hypothetical protein